MHHNISQKKIFSALKIKQFLLIITLFFLNCHGNSVYDTFYSTAFLKDYKSVRRTLKNIGFEDTRFKTSDNIELAGLFLSRPNATCNVIICAGWLPGRKEGMATFYALLPENCNILLFDARGHGESKGPLFWKLWRYGIDEYRDIVAATTFINNRNALPIVVVGICSGAFNAAHAIAHLKKNALCMHHHIRGLVFDSGWGSVSKIITTAPIAGIRKRLASLFHYFCNTKKQILCNYFYQIFSRCADYVCIVSNCVCAQPLARPYEHITNLRNKMKNITIPILFIHSHDDVYADINDAQELARLAPNTYCWWIEKSSHAKHHLIHQDLYKKKLAAFINTVI